MQKVEIKLIGSEINGDIYITKKGTYLCDVNFNHDNPPKTKLSLLTI